MIFALQRLDAMIEDAIRFCEINSELILIFASSMGTSR